MFDTYDSLLSESQRSDWTKIVEDLCRSDTYLSRRNKPKAGPRGQTLEAFHDCIHAHLCTVFSHDAAEQERHYLQCCVKKSPKISIRNFIARMNQLNGYLSLLPCLYDSEYAINTTCLPVGWISPSRKVNWLKSCWMLYLQLGGHSTTSTIILSQRTCIPF